MADAAVLKRNEMGHEVQRRGSKGKMVESKAVTAAAVVQSRRKAFPLSPDC